jgi:hypothetical protein
MDNRPDNPKNSAGRFAATVPITDRRTMADPPERRKQSVLLPNRDGALPRGRRVTGTFEEKADLSAIFCRQRRARRKTFPFRGLLATNWFGRAYYS